MSTVSSATPTSVTLSPDYRLSIAVLLAGLGLWLVQLWLSLVIGLLGLFLLIQTTIIRLTFTKTELQVCRGTTILRQFPYAEWQYWTIFWSSIPILFYFREVKSIHFLPMLFNPTGLRSQLEQHCNEVG